MVISHSYVKLPEGMRPGAGTYVRIRGLVAWAALMQSVALSGLLAAKDSVTPLKAGQVEKQALPSGND